MQKHLSLLNTTDRYDTCQHPHRHTQYTSLHNKNITMHKHSHKHNHTTTFSIKPLHTSQHTSSYTLLCTTPHILPHTSSHTNNNNNHNININNNNFKLFYYNNNIINTSQTLGTKNPSNMAQPLTPSPMMDHLNIGDSAEED